jgi:hypothetical protein
MPSTTASQVRIPISSEPRTIVTSDGSSVLVPANAILLWAKITPWGYLTMPVEAPFFPVVLDTGLGVDLAISQRQLAVASRFDAHAYRQTGERRVSQFGASGAVHAAAMVGANLWLTGEPSPQADAFFLELEHVILSDDRLSRIPLLGIGPLKRVGAEINVDLKALVVTVRTG